MLIRSQNKKSLGNTDANRGLWVTRRVKDFEIIMDAMGSLEVRRSKRVGKSRKRHSA